MKLQTVAQYRSALMKFSAKALRVFIQGQLISLS